MTTVDAVVVGAGPNGLVAANHLADAGWDVLVLEAQPDLGGAVHSDRELHPDFVHDTFSAFYPLAAASPTLQSFELERYGLRWVHAPAVLGHPMPDGSWALLDRDRDLTARWMDAAQPGDGERWLEWCTRWDRIGEEFIGALLSPFPPVRHGLGALLRLPGVGGLQFVRDLLTPAAALGKQQFRGEGPRLLLAGNAGHADIPLDAPGSSLLGLLLVMLGQTVGFPVPEGGAGQLAEALADRFRSRGGGTISHNEPAVRIRTDGRRATTVQTPFREISVRHAVLADTNAEQLFGTLLDPSDVPAKVLRRMETFQLDPGTVKVDWALSGPVPWQTEPAKAPGTVHIADSVDQMSEALSQVSAGLIPAKPFMLTGQMTTTDPTRSPEGTESFWAYTHVPQDVRSDAGDEGIRGAWDHDDCERFADRMQARLEERAPGFGDRILTRRVLGPRELEARNANLVGGALNGGTAQLNQQLIFRPVAGMGRAETGVPGVYLASASAHPGGGVHGACGMNAARAALAHHRLRRLTLR